MALPMTPLSIVEEWKNKCQKSSQPNDGIVLMMNEGFKAMEIILKKESTYKQIKRGLAYLDCERELSLKRETLQDGETRDLMYGLGQCLRLTLSELTQGRNTVEETGGPLIPVKEEPNQDVLESPTSFNENSHRFVSTKQEDLSNLIVPAKQEDRSYRLVVPKEEDHDYCKTVKQEDLSMVDGDPYPILENENSWRDMRLDVVNVNGTTFSEIFGTRSEQYVGIPLVKQEPEDEEAMDYRTDNQEDPFVDAVDVKYGVKRSSRKISRPMSYFEYDDESDRDVKPALKMFGSGAKKKTIKRRSSYKGSGKSEPEMKPRFIKKHSVRNDGELKCPECDYRTFAVDTWQDHLKFQHSLNPAQAGVALRCDCGHESAALRHRRECDMANFTVIRTSHSKCIMCPVYPSTANAYAQHLKLKHGTTLAKNGIYLKCSCGLKVGSQSSNPEHTKRCDGRVFTIHKIDAE